MKLKPKHDLGKLPKSNPRNRRGQSTANIFAARKNPRKPNPLPTQSRWVNQPREGFTERYRELMSGNADEVTE